MSPSRDPHSFAYLLPFFVAASGQENEPGHEENLLAVEGSGPGGDQHRCAVQLPGVGTAVFDRPVLACRDGGLRWDMYGESCTRTAAVDDTQLKLCCCLPHFEPFQEPAVKFNNLSALDVGKSTTST